MPLARLTVIDTILTKPGVTTEAEYQRRINTINAVTTFCYVEEGRPTPRLIQSLSQPVADEYPSCPSTKRPRQTDNKIEAVLREAKETVQVKSRKKRPKFCFLCIRNRNLSLEDRVQKYATSGSLRRHFLRRHVNPPWPTEGVKCNICGREPLQQKASLINHAETTYGIVVRYRAQERYALDLGSCPHTVS